jgi:hypothetical protein
MNNKHKQKQIETDKLLPSTKHEQWDNDSCQEEPDTELTLRLPAGLKGLVGI